MFKFLILLLSYFYYSNAQHITRNDHFNLENIRWTIANEFNITLQNVEVTCNKNCYSDFNFKVYDKSFICNPVNAENIQWAIANELGIDYENVEVTCDDFNG